MENGNEIPPREIEFYTDPECHEHKYFTYKDPRNMFPEYPADDDLALDPDYDHVVDIKKRKKRKKKLGFSAQVQVAQQRHNSTVAESDHSGDIFAESPSPPTAGVEKHHLFPSPSSTHLITKKCIDRRHGMTLASTSILVVPPRS